MNYSWVLVALGGSAGALARYWLQQAVQGRYPLSWPVGTGVVNVLGCLLAGLLLGLLERPWVRAGACCSSRASAGASPPSRPLRSRTWLCCAAGNCSRLQSTLAAAWCWACWPPRGATGWRGARLARTSALLRLNHWPGSRLGGQLRFSLCRFRFRPW